jgi:hypothetical protein
MAPDTANEAENALLPFLPVSETNTNYMIWGAVTKMWDKLSPDWNMHAYRMVGKGIIVNVNMLSELWIFQLQNYNHLKVP